MVDGWWWLDEFGAVFNLFFYTDPHESWPPRASSHKPKPGLQRGLGLMSQPQKHRDISSPTDFLKVMWNKSPNRDINPNPRSRPVFCFEIGNCKCIKFINPNSLAELANIVSPIPWPRKWTYFMEYVPSGKLMIHDNYGTYHHFSTLVNS